MAVSLAKFKEIATSAETELVRASRKPAITSLTTAELKQMATRARKLRDKWQDLTRSQARDRSKAVGFGEIKANTELKLQAFAEALQSFEAQLAKQGIAPVAKKKAPGKTKQSRNAGHRAARATVRKKLSAVQESFKEPTRKAAKKKAKKAVAKKAITAKAPDEEFGESTETAPEKKVPKRGRPASTPTATTGLGLNKGKNRKATTAAKQSKFDRSGITSRVRGHVMARGKRTQSRRDARG
jgi:hypothetical protein